MSEFDGGSSMESGGSSEVSETPVAETGGEASEATQEATTEEAGESGGFDNAESTEAPEDSDEESEDTSSIEESDESREAGFTEENDIDNSDSQYDDTNIENDTSPTDENSVGFDDSDGGYDENSDVGDDDSPNEAETYDDTNPKDSESTTDGDVNPDSNPESAADADNDIDSEQEDESVNWDEPENDDHDEFEDYSGEDNVAGNPDTDGSFDGSETDINDNIDGEQDDGETQSENPDSTDGGNEVDGNTDNNPESGSDADDDIDNEHEDESTNWDEPASEDIGELEDYSNQEKAEENSDIDNNIDGKLDGDETQSEDSDSTIDGNEADGDANGDGNPDSDPESGPIADENIDDKQSNDDNIDDQDVYDEDEDPGVPEDYSKDDSNNRKEVNDATSFDNDAERDKAKEEVSEENKEAVENAENENQNANAETVGKDGDNRVEDEIGSVSEDGVEPKSEPIGNQREGNEVDINPNSSRNEVTDTAEIQDTRIDSADDKDSATDSESAYRTAMSNMADYMNEHNYGSDDYAEYSEDPEWYKLNSALQESSGMEVSPPTHEVAMSNMADYMNEHNYGRDDYAEYSQDPEWQKLSGDLQQSLGIEATTDSASPSPERGKDISTTELPDNCVMVNASDIDMTYAQGMDSDQFWNHHGNTKEDYMRVAERIPDVQQALDSGKSLDEIKQDPDLKDTAHAYFDPENMVKVEQQADGSYSFNDDGRHRIAAAQEFGYEMPVQVTNISENTNAANGGNGEINPATEAAAETVSVESSAPEGVVSKGDISSETRESLGSFEQNNWDNLSQAGKEQAIEKLRDSVAEDLQLENKPNIAHYNKEDPGDYGGYAASNNTIYINRFNMGDSAETADTIAHESRHCWQHERSENPQTEEDYQFKENFDDYIRPEDDFYEYQNQPVEADARDYAQGVRDAIPESSQHPDTDARHSYEGNDRKKSDDAPPSTTGLPESTDNKVTENVSELPDDFERKTDFTPVSNDVKKSLESSGLADDKINPNDIYDGNVGHSSGVFVTSGEDMKKAIQEPGGDVRKMGSILGLEEKSLGNNPTIISINAPNNLRMPSGNELGASQKEFIHGGFTSGNQPEAVIDSYQEKNIKQ